VLPPGWRARAPRLVTGLTALYAGTVLGLCLLLYLGGDRWWLATLLLYVPRWPWALPLAVLVPAASVLRRRLLWVDAPVLTLLLFPWMGLCVPRPAFPREGPRGRAIRVLTCNVHRHQLNAAALGTLVAMTDPDIVTLQGWSSRDKPVVFAYGRWHVRQEGQLCLASHYPIRSAELLDDPDFTGEPDSAAGRFEIEAPEGSIHVVSLHLASPRDGLEEVGRSWGREPEALEANSALRRRQSRKVRRWLADWEGPVLIAGDFNTPTESTVYREWWSPYTNAFCSAGWGFGATFFTARNRVRIDHILAGPGWRCRRCWVGPPVGSPHRPVLADLYLASG
jgi:endonuclease/exonuclease/phosphatase (EEP) superfamily protein YafD